jgi:para-nitrobenzyl esterase
MRLRVFGVVLLSIAAMTAAVPSASAGDLIVRTRSGLVEGVDQGAVDAWLGIPYAAPPVGDLRWRPPAPPEPWEGIRDGSDPGPECPQLLKGPGRTVLNGREDCLHLNVFAPSSASPLSPLPVMVHLHPGRNTVGRGYLDASAFVSRGVIVVTLNYRLGVFGFVGHPALSEEGGGSSGEYGVLDQIAALHWVQDNIPAFGGDPENVTLFGASAGSFDTVAIMTSPLADGLLARAAVQADVFWGVTGLHTQINAAEALGERVADSAGCGHHTDVLPCLRAAPFEDILVAGALNGASDFLPWVGGVVMPKSPLELIAEGDGVPLLIGFDREEETPFLYPFPDPYPYRAWLYDTEALVGPQRAEQLRDLYPRSDYESLWWNLVTALTDAVRGCPTRRLALANPAPTYRWLYTHTLENDPYLAGFKAGHFLEDGLLWHTPKIFGIPYTPTPAEEVLSDRMTDYWTNFAKTGDPNGPGLPEWPLSDAETDLTLTLDNEIGVETYHAEQCAFLDTIPIPFP